MKKLFTLAVAFLFGASAFAQNQGDMAIKATASFNYNSTTTKGAVNLTADDTNFSGGLGFTYFVIDNLGVSLDVNYNGELDAVGITPSVAYYVPLASNFFYTPTLGFDFIIRDPFRFGIDLHFAAFEYRMNDLLAFNFSLGAVSFATDNDFNIFNIGVNNGGSIGVRFYL